MSPARSDDGAWCWLVVGGWRKATGQQRGHRWPLLLVRCCAATGDDDSGPLLPAGQYNVPDTREELEALLRILEEQTCYAYRMRAVSEDALRARRHSDADALTVRWFTCPPVLPVAAAPQWTGSPQAAACAEHLRTLAAMRLRDEREGVVA